MTKRKKRIDPNAEAAAIAEPQTPSSKPPLKNLFAQTNRGMLFDILIFIANIFLMRYLTQATIELFTHVSKENPLAKLTLSLIAVSMWVLPALGSILKRWHLHQRLKTTGKTFDPEASTISGCLFNPIFYFCLNLVLTSAILTGLGDTIFGKALMNNGPLFISLTVTGLILTIIQTAIIYLYFSPPKKPPRWQFLQDPRSEVLGDLCFFLNLILFQVAWNLLTFSPLGPPSGFLEFAGRLFFLCFIALLVYFPPRMFYLAEDIDRPVTWLTMLLANSPVILRVVFGTSSGTMLPY